MSVVAQGLGYAILALLALLALLLAAIAVYVAGWLIVHRGDEDSEPQLPDDVARLPVYGTRRW